jgi:Mrp family chromosome partitioning ATPase
MNDRNGAKGAVSVAIDPALNSEAQLLSVRIEGALSKPAVVMITSASAGDGKSVTAHLLAGSLEKCNHRVSLMEISNGNDTPREQLSTLVEEMRSNYDFAIIDAATFPKNSTVLSLARLVDGIVVAVRMGRAPTADDECMVRILEQVGGNVVGVVATEADAIATFERARGEKPADTRLQPRRSGGPSPAHGLTVIATERMSR